LARELGKFFNRLRKEVLSALEEYWSDYQMLQGHINLICSPVHEAHREYFELLSKYIRKEYKLGQAEARRLVKQANSKYAHKSKIEMPIQGIVSTQRDDKGLFATIPQAEQDLLNRTFRTSEQTLSRVDNQINQIITDGYRSGKGINDIGNQLTKRFDQLSTWEARRIARTEVNTSHNKATMDTYKELNVEYTQWIAANDDRTRDSHAEIDGEIIPVGGHYSNGLEYPGDMSGPIEEWINCRCSNAPFVIPYGYIAPSFSPFREEDLVPVEAKSFEEIMQQATQEAQEQLPHESSTTPSEIKTITNTNDLLSMPSGPELKELGKILTPQRRKAYSKGLAELKKLINKYNKASVFEKGQIGENIAKQKEHLKQLETDSIKAKQVKEPSTVIEEVDFFETLNEKQIDIVAERLTESRLAPYSTALEELESLLSRYEKASPAERPKLKEFIAQTRETMRKLEADSTKTRMDVSKISLESFKADKQVDNIKEISPLEQKQIEAQRKVKLSERDIDGMDYYLGPNYMDMASYIYNTQHIKDVLSRILTKEGREMYIKDIKQKYEQIKKTMEKTPGCVQDTIYFRGGKFDENMEVGEIGKWECPTSTSYQKRVAENFVEEGEYLIEIYAPAGTKGVAVNDGRFHKHSSSHEYTLGPDQEFVLLEIDRSNRTCKILLLN